MNALLLNQILQDPWLLMASKAAFLVAAGVALVAVLSPAAFARFALLGGTWLDTNPLFESFDRPVVVDAPCISHCRAFGWIVLCGAAVLTALMPTTGQWLWVGWSAVGTFAVIGVVAIICPACFRRLAAIADTWIDTTRFFSALDRRIDIDTPIIRHSRVFGTLVLVTIVAVSLKFYWS